MPKPAVGEHYDWVIVKMLTEGREPPRKATKAEKVEVVRLFLKSGLPQVDFPAQAVLGRRTLERWIQWYTAAAQGVGLERPLRIAA